MVLIFINGYGNIGRRLATALSKDKSIKLIGIAKYSPDEETEKAINKGYEVFVPKELEKEFKNKKYNISGTVEDAIKQADIIIDAAKEGKGFKNKNKYYIPLKKKAIFQGGEDRKGRFSVADIIHNSRVNYKETYEKEYVIQGSCNVTGMGRIIQPLLENYGESIKRYDVNLVRRWADLEDKKEVKDSIEWDKQPHHQDDVKDFIPSINLYVDSLKVPSRMMHLHQMTIRFKNKPPSKDKILEIFDKEFGVAVLNKASGTADIRNKAIELKFEHGDTGMVHIHQEILKIQDDIVKISYSDDQTGMVIPENYLLIQSMVLRKSKIEALKQTDKIFNIRKKRKKLEEEL
ncbi:MAG: type II glyceraldehyde-3-phosphate dehydrogenase [Nitrosopumilus sp.]|nr:type II glyceraldehyde-3-phosphate dehydrogenase [Nitrosopumilus sp.]